MASAMIPFLLTAALFGLASPQEAVHYPPRPGPHEFLLDEAKLVSAAEAAEIRSLAEDALTKKKAPILVVTIPSLATYGAAGWPIERYAMNLMAEWGVGWADWNYGMLLLVSTGDRKARIELGGSWARRKDDEAQRVMSERIVPNFKRGDFGKGILEGVKGLHAIAFDAVPKPTVQPGPALPTPVPGRPADEVGKSRFGGSWGLIGLGGIVLLVLFVISRVRRGVTSWGAGGPGNLGNMGNLGNRGGGFASGLGGGLLGGALGSMIYNAMSRRGNGSSGPSIFGGGSGSSGGGGSFGGGSFGGGFSGGGGATGSW